MIAIADPGNLVAQHLTQQFAVGVEFFHARIISKIDFLINVEWFVPSQCFAIFTAVYGADIQARAGKQLHQLAGSLLVGDGMNPGAGRNPFFKGHIATFEQEPEFLPIHPARLGKAVIEIDRRVLAIPNGAIDLFLDFSAGSQCALGSNNLTPPEPAGEHVKKMHAMLDENATALRGIPKPMLHSESFVRSVVFKEAMEKFTQHF